MIKFLGILLCCFFAITRPAYADIVPDYWGVSIASYHVDPKWDFNETNPGIFAFWEVTESTDFSLGIYHNSFSRVSVSTVFFTEFLSTENVDFSILYGLAYYPEDGRYFAAHVGNIVPVGGISADFGRVSIQFIPSDGNITDGIFTLMLHDK